MGLLLPVHRGEQQDANYSGRPVAPWGTLLTASATPHALSATRTTLIASTKSDSSLLVVTVTDIATAATVTDVLLNLYIGAAASEVLFVDSLYCAAANSNLVGGQIVYAIPVRIARGTRISGTIRALIASETASVSIQLFESNGFDGAGVGVETVGAVTASSRGTAVTPGTTAEGTFTAIGTTVRSFKYVYAVALGNVDTTMTQGQLGLDLGISTTLIPGLENFGAISDANERSNMVNALFRKTNIAAGTALTARLQSHTTDAEAKYVCIYGVY